MSEKILETLISAVQTHYGKSKQPLYLSRLGDLLKESKSDIIAQYGSLLKAVKSIAGNTLDVINETQPGGMIVVTPEAKAEVQARISSTSNDSETLFDSLPLPLRIAFGLKSEAGQTIGIKLGNPMRYVRLDAGTPLPAGYTMIDNKYRFPGLDLRSATVKEKERMWKEILSWASDNSIDVDFLRKTTRPTNALERLLAAQPGEILERMVLPADIAAILVRHT